MRIGYLGLCFCKYFLCLVCNADLPGVFKNANVKRVVGCMGTPTSLWLEAALEAALEVLRLWSKTL